MKPESDTYSAVGEVGAVHERRSLWTRTIIDLRKAPYTALFGMIIILAYARKVTRDIGSDQSILEIVDDFGLVRDSDQCLRKN